MSRRDRQRVEPPAPPREPATTPAVSVSVVDVDEDSNATLAVTAPTYPPRITLDAEPVYLPRAAVPPSGAVWNGIRRAWLVPGPDGALVVADPQPPPPERSFTTGAPAADVPPSVKISA